MSIKVVETPRTFDEEVDTVMRLANSLMMAVKEICDAEHHESAIAVTALLVAAVGTAKKCGHTKEQMVSALNDLFENPTITN